MYKFYHFICRIILLNLLIASFIAKADARNTNTQELFLIKKYKPRLELVLKGGNARNIGRLGMLVPINKGLLFSNIFGLLDSRSNNEGNLGLGCRHIFYYC